MLTKRLFGSLLVLALTAPLLRADDEKDPAGWVPPDAILYVGIADVAQVVKDYQATAGYKMLTEMKSGGASITAVVNKGIEKFKERLARLLETTPAQLKNPFGGPAALYATLPPDAKSLEDMQPGLVAGVGDKGAMQAYYETAVRKLREAAGSYESVSAGSYSIDVFTRKEGAASDAPDADADEDEEFESDNPLMMNEEELGRFFEKQFDEMFSAENVPERLAVCLADDRLIVAATPEQVKNVLRASEGDTLLDGDEHKALVRNFKPLGGVRLLVNIRRMIELARSSPDAEEDDKKMMDALGVQAFQAIVGHAALGTADFDAKLELDVLMQGERSGLAKLLSLKNRPITPPATVDSSTAIHASINLSALDLLDEIERILRQIDPDQADEMRASLEAVPLPNSNEKTLNLRKELFENLREPIQFNLGFGRPFGAESARLLLSISHRNQDAITKLLGLFGGMLTTREVRGTQVYDFVMMGVSFAPTTDQIHIGNSKAVELALGESRGDSLASDSEFERAAKLMPAEAWGMFYFDYARLLEAVIGFAKNKAEIEGAGMGSMSAGVAMGLLESFGAALGDDPDAEGRKMLKHAAPAIVTIETTADGIRYTQVQLHPKDRDGSQ